jgi:hypothetical protein
LTPRRALVRHFLRQFTSFEAVSTGGEARHAIIAVVSLLAGPGYLTAVVTARGGRARELTHEGIMPRDLWLWSPEWLLLSVSLVAITALVAVQWRSFVLGGRDYRILGVLPVRRRTVMSARLLSLLAVVLMLHVAINALPGLWLPVASPFGWFRAAFALEVALLMQTVFACSTVVALQGAVGAALPPGIARRVSSVLQGAFLLGSAVLFVSEGAISRLAFATRDASHLVNRVVPVVWFRALYVQLLGVDSAPLAAQARFAWVATAVAVAAAVPCSLLGFRDAAAGGGGHRSGRGHPLLGVGRILERGPARPVARAVASFVGAAVLRSPGASLIARGLLVVGLALTLSGLLGLAMSDLGSSAPVIPAEPLHAPAFVLPFFALVGLRLAAAYPASIEANWVFRLTETTGSADYAAGVRWAAVRAVVAPLLVLLAVPYAVLWGPWTAAAHLLLGLAVALVTVEWLFLGFPKIPFTCTYLPGKANLRVTWPKYGAIFLVYGGLVPRVGAWLLARPVSYGVSVALLVVAWRWLARRRDEQARAGPLVFDEKADAHVTVLGLEWRQAADRRRVSEVSDPA